MKKFVFFLFLFVSFVFGSTPECGGGYQFIKLVGGLGLYNNLPKDTKDGWHCINSSTADYWRDCKNSGESSECYAYRYELTNTNSCSDNKIYNPVTFTCECPPLPTGAMSIPQLTTSETCNLSQAMQFVRDGDTRLPDNVFWDSCRNACYGTAVSCPCNQNVKNGVCSNIPPPSSCPNPVNFYNDFSYCVGDGCRYPSGCFKTFVIPGTNVNCGSFEAGCCTNDGNGTISTPPPPDSNTTPPPDSNISGGTGDNNSTSDNNSTGGGDGGGGVGSVGSGSSSGSENNSTNDGNSTIIGGGSTPPEEEKDKGNLDFLTEAIGGILNKYNINYSQPCGSIQPIGLNLWGHSVVILSQDVIDMLPMSAIKAFIIFMFTLVGVISVFAGGV